MRASHAVLDAAAIDQGGAGFYYGQKVSGTHPEREPGMGRTMASKTVSASLRGGARTRKPETKSVPWWKKSFVRIGTLMVAALSTAITAWLQPQIASWL